MGSPKDYPVDDGCSNSGKERKKHMSVKTYSLKKDGNKKLSSHFRVREFRCKDGTDKIFIESDIITVLEKVFKHFDCSKIDIVSGYRTASHDKAVGGKGSGNHVQGKAVDFKAYDKHNTLITSKEICLYLEDIGIKGIGYRSGGNAFSTHIDVNYRTNKWYGDEMKSMSASIGDSFYDYLDVKYTTKTVKVNSSLKVREKPFLTGKVVKKLKNGEKIKVADTASITHNGYKWVRVKIGNKHYWVASKYLK